MSSISAQGVVERASVELAKRINGKFNPIFIPDPPCIIVWL